MNTEGMAPGFSFLFFESYSIKSENKKCFEQTLVLAVTLKSSFVADVVDRLILAFHACNANKKYNYPTNILHSVMSQITYLYRCMFSRIP